MMLATGQFANGGQRPAVRGQGIGDGSVPPPLPGPPTPGPRPPAPGPRPPTPAPGPRPHPMTLQAKLTLGSVLLATLVVGLISAVDLANVMQLEFESTLDSAELLETQATFAVTEALNRQRTIPLSDALRDQALTDRLRKLVTASRAVLEIAVVEPGTNIILADTLPTRLGAIAIPNQDFAPLVNETGWLAKARVLLRSDVQYYQLQDILGPSADKPLLYVRVIVLPSLIRNKMVLTMNQTARIAVFSVVGAVVLTFLFSTLAVPPAGPHRAYARPGGEGRVRTRKAGNRTRPATDELSGDGVEGQHAGPAAARRAVRSLRPARQHRPTAAGSGRRRLHLQSRSAGWSSRRVRSRSFSAASAPTCPASPIVRCLPAGHHAGTAGGAGRADRPRHPQPARPDDACRAKTRSGLAVVLLSVDILETLPGGTGAGSAAFWSGCATPKRSARSTANCRRPTAWPPSAASPAAWRTKSRIR